MTEKQKQAISLLNRLKDNISEEEYFLLLDFIVGKDNPVYVPYYPNYPTYPYITWDNKPLPEMDELWERRRQKLMELSKEDLVELIIGRKRGF